jgi:hypothetical protein
MNSIPNGDLSIKEVIPDPDRMDIGKEIHPNLPDISTGALGLMVAPVKSGKSTIITNLLLNHNFYRDCFDQVHIISNTIMNDNTSRFLKESFPGTVYGSYSDRIIQAIIDQQLSYKNKKDRPIIAIILDDFVGIPRNSLVYKLASRYRHYGIALLLFSSQVFKEVHPLVRTNMTFSILGKNSNAREMLKITEELGNSFGGDNNFKRICKHVWKTPFAFVHIDHTENPPTAYQSFERMVWDGRKPLEPMKGVQPTSDSDDDLEDEEE